MLCSRKIQNYFVRNVCYKKKIHTIVQKGLKSKIPQHHITFHRDVHIRNVFWVRMCSGLLIYFQHIVLDSRFFFSHTSIFYYWRFVASRTHASHTIKIRTKSFSDSYFSVNICLSCIRMHSTDFDWNWFAGFLVVRRVYTMWTVWWQLRRLKCNEENCIASSYRCTQFDCSKCQVWRKKRVYLCDAWIKIFSHRIANILTMSVTIIIHAIIIELSLLKHI